MLWFQRHCWKFSGVPTKKSSKFAKMQKQHDMSYLCSKCGWFIVLGWCAFFTLGSTVHDWGWPKNGPFWTKNSQTWQACQCSKVVQKGPNGQPNCFWPFGPFWAQLDPFGPFQTKIDILLESTSAKPYLILLGRKKIIFVWNGPKGSRWAQTGSQMIKKT